MKTVFFKALALGVLVFGTFAFGAAPAAPQTMDYWFDECGWDGTAGQILDHSGNDRHGQSFGAGMNTATPGVVVRDGNFTTDNITDYVVLPLSSLNGLTNFTISFWFKTKAAVTGDTQAFFDSQQSDQAQNGDFDMAELRVTDANQIVVNLGDQSYYNMAAPSGKNLLDQAWHHITWTRTTGTGNNNCIYLDGALVQCINRTDVGALRVSYFELGQEMDGIPASGGNFDVNQDFEGYMDEFEIYSGVLTAAEVTAIYNDELAGKNYDGTTRPAGAVCPVANADVYLTNTTTPLSGNVLTNDTGEGITVTADTPPAHGTLSGVNADGSFTYTPTSGYTGTDSFTYTITDTNGKTSTATVTITIQAAVTIPANLIAEYRLDECAFDGTAGDVIDNSTNRLHGTSSSGVVKTTAPNKICKGAVFNGSNLITVADNTLFNFSTNDRLTVSFWVNVVAGTTAKGLLGKSNATVTAGWAFDIDANERVTFRIGDGDNGNSVRSAALAAGWHHIVGVLDTALNPDMRLYVDGTDRGNDTASNFTNSTEPLYIGRTLNQTNYSNLAIDEVKIFNTLLTAAQVTAMYTNENALRNWNNTTTTRVCNTCEANATFGANGNFWHLVSLQSDFRNPAMTAKTTSDVMTPEFSASNYDPSNSNPSGWIMIRRDYAVGTAPSGGNNASYHTMGINEDLEYGKAYWLGSKTTTTWNANTKTMDFNKTVTDYPACRSANGKCTIVDLVEPNGTGNKGPYIYTMTSFPIAAPIRWANVRILIDGTAYTPDAAQALGQTFNATIWEYDPTSKGYTTVTPGTPGQGGEIRPYVGYWIELDRSTAGKTVQLLIPQE